MLRKRLLVAAVVAVGSCLGFAGGAATAPAMSAPPVLGYCSDQTAPQQALFDGVGPYVGVACLDNSAGGPIGPECMIYTEMGDQRDCKEWVAE